MATVARLRGAGSTGKTTTLKLLIEELKNLGAKELLSHANSDYKAVTNDIIVKLDFNGVIIGITTAGDTEGSLQFGYDKLDIDCDIYIFACRTKGATNSWIDNNFSNCRSVIYEKWGIYDTDSTNLQSMRNAANKAQVDSLIDLIKHL